MRRLAIILGCLAAGVLIALAALPWWLGPVAKIVARRYGTEIGRYERIGYSRFAVHDVNVTQGPVKVHAARAETQTPLLWLFHHWFGQPAEVVVSTWRVEVIPSTAPSPPSPDMGAMRLRVILFKVANALDRWLPRATIGAGAVTWKGGGLQLDAAQWQQRSLTVRPLRYGQQAAEVQGTFTTDDKIVVRARSTTELPWEFSATSVRDEITGEARLWEQAAPITAKFAPRGWMPVALETRLEHWSIPAAKLKLGESYATVHGEARLEWRDGRFETSAEVAGDALPEKKAPPLSAKIHARGDGESVAIDSLSLDIPGVNARLTEPVRFSRKESQLSAASRFSLELDLANQPWIPEAKGKVAGTAQLIPVAGSFPRIEGSLQAENLAVRDFAIARFAAGAIFEWPRVRVTEATVGFAEGGQLKARGALDLQAKEFSDVALEGVLHRSVIAPWVPEKLQFDAVTLAAEAHGPWAAPEHSGKVSVAAFRSPPVNPLDAELTWRGTGTQVEISEGHATAGKSRVSFAGQVEPRGAHVTALRFEQGGAERLALQQPVTIAWAPKVEVGVVQLAGSDASLSLRGTAGETGALALTVNNFRSTWLDDFLTVPGPEWQLAKLDATGDWNRGPAKFSLRGQLAVTLAPERFAQVTLAAQNEGAGIKIESLRVAEGEASIVNATGQLPVALYPGAAEIVRLEKDAPLLLHAVTATNPDFWKKLTEATGLEFQEPEVSVDLTGTWERPQGTVSAKARRVAADPARIKFPFPTVEALDAHATADDKGITVDRLVVQVEGQAVQASGHLPLTFKQWPEFRAAPVEFLRREADLRLEIPDAEVAAFSRYTGKFLAPTGRLQVDLTLQRGGEMGGALRLQDATTLPLGPLGVLQEVEADVRLTGRTLELKNVGAHAGGQPVAITGKVELPLKGPPKYDLALKGENLPLVRETGLLLRADLDLKLATQADNITAVTGTVGLRDSMFLSDVRALIPHGGGGGPTRRPPFFSVDLPPLNTWRLGIDVRGERFMRLRSTVFVGVASAHFRLGGTLGEPRATGEATVDSGQVLLPFATFRVEQGTVRLTEADPYSLRLFMVGTSRRYGYDLRMELTGTAADPVVAFSSSPPLDAKQVLLMVTAGELPHDEITYGGAQRMARLGTYLGQSLLNNFGGDAADADRLSIATGERISRQGRETYDVEYRLNDRFTVVGEYDEFDEYNVGVKWRVFNPKKENEPQTAERKGSEKKEERNAPTR
jgi:translocation and assembly module TamB